MTFRDEERKKAKAEAALEPLNTNNFNGTTSPLSTRTRAERAAETNRAPDPEPVIRDHDVAAGCGSVVGFSRVRDRMAAREDKKREQAIPKPTPRDEIAEAYAEYNERWRQRTGSYPSN